MRGSTSHGCRGVAGISRKTKGVGLRAKAKAMEQPPDPKGHLENPEYRLTAVGAIGVASKPAGLNISK